MKKIAVILLFTLAFCFTNPAQTKRKQTALPSNLARLKGEYPFEFFLKKPAVKSRLKTLLGKSYSAFFDSFETTSRFEKKGNFLFSHGCLIHACSQLESAIAIDLINHTIHIGIFRRDEPNKIYNEDNRKTPVVLTTWFNNLSKNQ